MIVDCFTHIWDDVAALGAAVAAVDGALVDGAGTRVLGESAPEAGIHRHATASEPVDRAIVVGFQSRYLGVDYPNQRLHAHVESAPDRLIGFAGIDPSEPRSAIDELARAQDEWGMAGIAVAPAAQDIHPSHTQSMRVYAEAARRGMPVLFHSGITWGRLTKLAYGHPMLLDEVARELPDLRILIAHLGFPWYDEAIALLARHPNVFAEISLTQRQSWRAYQAMVSAWECGVMDKLLFGSGFPFATASAAIEALYSINHVCHGTDLPTIPRESVRGIVEQDALERLGIPPRQPRRTEPDHPPQP
ncbi:MAG: amidohydrolase [Phycisphaerales bacterium]|nr:MAG: amidohydrolase [Phycisphaerales bacterium]